MEYDGKKLTKHGVYTCYLNLLTEPIDCRRQVAHRSNDAVSFPGRKKSDKRDYAPNGVLTGRKNASRQASSPGLR